MPGPSADSFWDEFARRRAPQVQPEGSITIQQYAERYGVKPSVARGILQNAAEAGDMVSEMRRMEHRGEVRSVRCFSPVKAKS